MKSRNVFELFASMFTAAALVGFTRPIDMGDWSEQRVHELATAARALGGNLDSLDDLRDVHKLALRQVGCDCPEWRLHLSSTAARHDSALDDPRVIARAWGTFKVPSRFVANRQLQAA